jgi:hypothetical protein
MSFSKTLKDAAASQLASQSMMYSLKREIPDEEWIIDTSRYLWYDDFDDKNISIIDDKKNITLDGNQISLSQEESSQFIPFEMPRRYDNFDMALNTTLEIHYVNVDGEEDYENVVNVKYNNEKLRFALLVPPNMTAKAGIVKFEVIATGINSKGQNYKWISRTCDKLNVIASLSGNGTIDYTRSDWYTLLTNEMNTKIMEAQDFALVAQESAVDAANTVSTASSVLKGEVLIQINECYNKMSELIATELLKYYTKEEIDKLFDEYDVSDQLIEITNRVYELQTDIPTPLDTENVDGLFE